MKVGKAGCHEIGLATSKNFLRYFFVLGSRFLRHHTNLSETAHCSFIRTKRISQELGERKGAECTNLGDCTTCSEDAVRGQARIILDGCVIDSSGH